MPTVLDAQPALEPAPVPTYEDRPGTTAEVGGFFSEIVAGTVAPPVLAPPGSFAGAGRKFLSGAARL